MDKTEILKKAECALEFYLRDIERAYAKGRYTITDIYLYKYYGAVNMLCWLGLFSEHECSELVEAGFQRYLAARFPKEAE